MSIALGSVFLRHERRIRLVFTNTLASGAFTASLYTVASEDGTAASPSVAKALAVSDSPNVVELQLGSDLTPGALYRISAPGVPATDLSTTPDPSDELARFGTPRTPLPAQGTSPAADLGEQLFGRDLRWTGSDFAETPAGDLDTATGAELLETDLTTRLLSNGLPWDRDFGLQAREAVDGAPGALASYRARAAAQLLEDDRVAAATASVDLSDPTEPTLTAEAQPIGGGLYRALGAISLRTSLG